MSVYVVQINKYIYMCVCVCIHGWMGNGKQKGDIKGHKQTKQNKTKHQGKKNDLSIICISERDGQG